MICVAHFTPIWQQCTRSCDETHAAKKPPTKASPAPVARSFIVPCFIGLVGTYPCSPWLVAYNTGSSPRVTMTRRVEWLSYIISCATRQVSSMSDIYLGTHCSSIAKSCNSSKSQKIKSSFSRKSTRSSPKTSRMCADERPIANNLFALHDRVSVASCMVCAAWNGIEYMVV